MASFGDGPNNGRYERDDEFPDPHRSAGTYQRLAKHGDGGLRGLHVLGADRVRRATVRPGFRRIRMDGVLHAGGVRHRVSAARPFPLSACHIRRRVRGRAGFPIRSHSRFDGVDRAIGPP